MSRVNANRVPWVAVLVQSVISVFFTVLAFIIVPYTLKTGFKPPDLSTVVYDILQAAVTVIWCVSMVVLFIDVIIIRYKYHDVFQRIRLAPDWVFYVCSVVGLFATGFGVYVTFTNPWTGLMTNSQWDLWIGGIGVLSLLIGAALFFVGQATIRSNVSDEEVIAQVTGGNTTGKIIS
jgi:glutamate:GABA antiporter